MKSMELEMGEVARAAKEKAAELEYIDGLSVKGLANGDHLKDNLKALSKPELSFETSQDEQERINQARLRTGGSLDDFRMNKEVSATLQEKTIKGVDEERVKAEKAKSERLATLKRDHVSGQVDIINLQEQIARQTDAKIRAAQEKVLEQFEREQRALEKEMGEMKLNS